MAKIKKRTQTAKHQQPGEEIRTLAHHVSEFTAVHRQKVTIVVAIVAVVVVLGMGYRLTKSMQEQKAAPLVASAYGYYRPFAGTAPDFAKALELYRDVRKRYPSTRSGAIAQYYIGNCLANLGRNEEALKEYQTFVAQYSGDTFLLGLVYERMGYVDSALGRQADAIKAFEQSEKLIGPGASTLELAKLYESAGNAAASQNKYKLIADKLAGTVWAMDAIGKVQKIAPSPAPAQPAGK
jgi:tetratricopeptide (TPR) repeat protein